MITTSFLGDKKRQLHSMSAEALGRLLSNLYFETFFDGVYLPKYKENHF
jgi:hypothetical protein